MGVVQTTNGASPRLSLVHFILDFLMVIWGYHVILDNLEINYDPMILVLVGWAS